MTVFPLWICAVSAVEGRPWLLRGGFERDARKPIRRRPHTPFVIFDRLHTHCGLKLGVVTREGRVLNVPREVAVVKYAFVRSRSWSTATAIKRLEPKLVEVRERARVVADLRIALEAEALEAAAFEHRLMEQLAVERGKSELRRSKAARSSSDPSAKRDPSPAVEAGHVESPIVPTVRSASVHTGPRRYDASTKVFSPISPNDGGSTRPIRPTLTPDTSADADILRLVSVLETPGLMHLMIMSEKAQADCRVQDIDVTEASLGLPLSEALIDHVFSVEVIPILADPDKAVIHLANIEATFQPRGVP